MNSLYFGDNLEVLRESIKDESVDLVYLDPPFNSKRDYNLLFKTPKGEESSAQITAFEDSWHWGHQAEHEFQEVITGQNTSIAELLMALRGFLGANDVLAYLTMMANRLIELHRVLKPTGSIYLHCDPTASHYLKLVMDGIFGPENFLNEIIWKRTGAHSSAKRYGPVHDVILFYGKTSEFSWTDVRLNYSEDYLNKYYKYDDGDGRLYWRNSITAAGTRNGSSGKPWRGFDPAGQGSHWKFSGEHLEELEAKGLIYWPPKGGWPQIKRYRDELKGLAVGDLWDDIDKINPSGSERLGYPTQKPLALLERIIQASSNPGDVVLDPFCGCGTAVDAAQKLGRQWIGIDITHLAVSLIEKRMKDRYQGILFDIHGTPKDLAGATNLAERDKYQFQWWACSLVEAQPFGGKKKGADGGIDGLRYLGDVQNGKPVTQKVLVSVKGGGTNAAHVRDLRGVLEREKGAIALFVTLEKPSKPMLTEAAEAGFFLAGNGKEYPRLQILTIEDLFGGKRPLIPDMSLNTMTFKKAAPHKKEQPGATPLFDE